MKSQRIDIAAIRREQIVEAAVAVIAEQGLQNLSLSEIENKAGMSRGQLTYYFPTKEDILLAVFDRLVQLTYQRIGTPAGQTCDHESGWEGVQHLLVCAVSPEWRPRKQFVNPCVATLSGNREEGRLLSGSGRRAGYL